MGALQSRSGIRDELERFSQFVYRAVSLAAQIADQVSFAAQIAGPVEDGEGFPIRTEGDVLRFPKFDRLDLAVSSCAIADLASIA